MKLVYLFLGLVSCDDVLDNQAMPLKEGITVTVLILQVPSQGVFSGVLFSAETAGNRFVL
jgi:hypothetical protein